MLVINRRDTLPAMGRVERLRSHVGQRCRDPERQEHQSGQDDAHRGRNHQVVVGGCHLHGARLARCRIAATLGRRLG